MSIPLAAISVATRSLILFSLKSLSAFCLWFWFLSPCMAAQSIFLFFKFLTILSAPCLVLEKSNT